MAKIKVRRGSEAKLPILDEGELGFTTDTKKLFVGTSVGNQLLINTADVGGDMLKGIYDTDNDGIVNQAEKVEWNGVQNKPTTFPPSTHNHTKAQITDFPTSLPANGGNADTIDGKHATDFVPLGSGKYIDGGVYLDTHPENGKVILPFINNDIAFLLKRGGSATIKKNGVEISTDLSNIFDGTPSYWAVGNYVNTDVIELELTLHKVFTWTNTIGISFGSSGWRAKDVTIQVMRSGTDTDWVTKDAIINNPYGQHIVTTSHLSGTGFDRVKITMTNLNSNIFRIAQVFVLNYGSSGLKETYMSRGGCDGVYGDILPFTDTLYDLGSISKRWKTIYANSFISNGQSVVLNNDNRLSDARPPTEHNHDDRYRPKTTALTWNNLKGV